MTEERPVLLVEDNEMNRDMLSRWLKRRGWTVILAPDAETALARFDEMTPRAVLMDVDLPGMNGWQATREVRRRPGGGGVPVVALTAYALNEFEEEAEAVGCDAFLTKPLDLDAVTATLQRLTAGSAA